jgi:hypothetical protein
LKIPLFGGVGGIEGFKKDISFRGCQPKGDEKRHGENQENWPTSFMDAPIK